MPALAAQIVHKELTPRANLTGKTTKKTFQSDHVALVLHPTLTSGSFARIKVSNDWESVQKWVRKRELFGS